MKFVVRRGLTSLTISGLALATVLTLATASTAAPTPPRYVLHIDVSGDIAALSSADPFVSDPAADHLAALGPAVVPVLATALRREPAATRVGIVGVLRQIESDEATHLLVEAADDRDAMVRADALLALGLRKAAAGAAVVERHLEDANARARRSAALACNSLCTSPAALARLVTLAIRDSEAPAAQQSLRTILSGGAAPAATAARAAIDAQAMPLLGSGDGDPLLRTNAAITAALAGRAEAVPVLVVAIAQPPLPPLKMTAVLALGAIPAPESVAALAPLTRSADPGVRNAACVSLVPLREQHVDGAEQAAATCGSATPTPVRQESP